MPSNVLYCTVPSFSVFLAFDMSNKKSESNILSGLIHLCNRGEICSPRDSFVTAVFNQGFGCYLTQGHMMAPELLFFFSPNSPTLERLFEMCLLEGLVSKHNHHVAKCHSLYNLPQFMTFLFYCDGPFLGTDESSWIFSKKLLKGIFM